MQSQVICKHCKLVNIFRIHNNSVLLLIILCLGLASNTEAAQFAATVNDNHISVNQPIKLNLMLTDAKAKGSPDLSGLEEYFITRSVHKFKNFSSINGVVTNEEGWQIILQPKMPGELLIPVIPIKTNKGMLYTQAINIYVDPQAGQENLSVSIEARVDKDEVFVQEPFIYTLTITNEKPMANIDLDKLELADCVIEEIAEPRRSQNIVNGKRVQITELKYLITPLKDGSITIPAISLRGDIEALQISKGGGLLDPFGNISIFGNFRQMHDYESFAVQTTPQQIHVKPAIADINPWLPLYGLEVKEIWQGLEHAKVGEPIIRDISMVGIGVTGQQLPTLKEQQEVEGIKVYTEEPSFTQEIDVSIDKLIGSRKERFSLIPTKSGVITIPAITITWWDLNKQQKVVTSLPKKVLNVSPTLKTNNNAINHLNTNMKDSALLANNTDQALNDTADNTTIDNIEMAPLKTTIFTAHTKILYLIIAILLVLLFAVIFFIWHYHQKMQKLLANGNTPSVSNSSTSVNSKKNYIKFIDNINAMQDFIRSYAMKHWRLSENVSLREIPAQLAANGYVFDQSLAAELFIALDEALYGRGKSSLEEIKSKWQNFSKEVIIANNKKHKKEHKIDNLNPT